MKKYYRLVIFIITDIICINVAYVLAFLLRYEFNLIWTLKYFRDSSMFMKATFCS